MKSIVSLLVCVLLGAGGQLLLKKGVTVVAAALSTPSLSMSAIIEHPVAVFLNPFVFFGFAAYGVSSLIYLSLASKFPLSILYPMISLGYVFVVIGSIWVFHDKPNSFTWAALLFIVIGVSLLARSGVGAH